jgi:hypothetical protein
MRLFFLPSLALPPKISRARYESKDGKKNVVKMYVYNNKRKKKEKKIHASYLYKKLQTRNTFS